MLISVVIVTAETLHGSIRHRQVLSIGLHKDLETYRTVVGPGPKEDVVQ
jgi:hypothetical protein